MLNEWEWRVVFCWINWMNTINFAKQCHIFKNCTVLKEFMIGPSIRWNVQCKSSPQFLFRQQLISTKWAMYFKILLVIKRFSFFQKFWMINICKLLKADASWSVNKKPKSNKSSKVWHRHQLFQQNHHTSYFVLLSW